MDDERKSSDGDELPLLVLADETAGDNGGEWLLAALAKNSECNALLVAWCAECWAAEMFASSDWNDALGEYSEPTPCANIGDGGVLQMKQTISINLGIKKTW